MGWAFVRTIKPQEREGEEAKAVSQRPHMQQLPRGPGWGGGGGILGRWEEEQGTHDIIKLIC